MLNAPLTGHRRGNWAMFGTAALFIGQRPELRNRSPGRRPSPKEDVAGIMPPHRQRTAAVGETTDGNGGMGRRTVIHNALIGAALLLGVVGAAQAEDPPLSQAQIALFESDHLKGITRPVRLEYAFEHRGGARGAHVAKGGADNPPGP